MKRAPDARDLPNHYDIYNVRYLMSEDSKRKMSSVIVNSNDRAIRRLILANIVKMRTADS